MRNRYRAFTLIELVVTVGVLILLAGFVIPTYQLLLSQFQLSSAASQVADYIRMTEQKTVTEQRMYGVTLTTDGAATMPNPATNKVISQFVYENGAENFAIPPASASLALPSTIVISSVNFAGERNIRFSASGAPNVSGNVVLTDTVRNRSRRIEVKPSGMVVDNTSEF